MANSLLTPSVIARESLFQLENNTVLGDKVYRQYKREFVKIGDTLSIRKPVKFVASDGATRVNQDVTEGSTSIVIDQRKHVSWGFTSQDLTLTIEEYSERYIKPAMIVLANKIDESLALEGATAFFNSVGTAGTTPDAFSDLGDVANMLDKFAVPDDGLRYLCLDPNARWALANGLGGTGSGGVFNADIVGPMVRKGRLGNLATLGIYGDQNIKTHKVGAYSGTPLVNDASFDNDTAAIAFDGTTGSVTGAFKKGDVITLAGVHSVNPVSKQSTGDLQHFVVTADCNTTAGAGTLSVYPKLNDGSTTASAAYQTVDALPADNAAITVLGTASTAYPQNLAFHRNALALVTVPLELPDSATFKARADWRGYSMRVVKFYDGDADQEYIRLDILYGVKAIYPELGVRLWG